MKSPSVERVVQTLGFLTLALWFAVFLEDPGVNHDAFHQMTIAREAVALGHVPHDDSFSYAPTRSPVVHHEWLAGIIVLGAYQAGGLRGVGLLWFAISAGCAAYCARALRRLPPPLAIAAGALSFPLITYSLFQPLVAQAWSVLVCGALLLCLEADANGQRRWGFAFLPAFILWVNLHGGAVVGIGIVAAYAAEQWLRGNRYGHLIALFGVMLCAMAFNPFTWHYYGYLVRALTMRKPQIPQWEPAWLLNPNNWEHSVPFGFLLAAYALAVAKAGPRFRGALVTALLAVATLRAHKLLPFFALAWLFYVPCVLSGTEFGRGVERLWKRLYPYFGPAFVAAAALLCALIWWNRPWAVRIPGDPAMGPIQPVGVADYLERTGFRGNVMTYFRHGAYLSWRLHPQVKVSCDGRYEAAYLDGHTERNLSLYDADPSLLQDELRRLPTTNLVLADRRQPLADQMSHLPGWSLVYSDPGFVLYAPTESPASGR